MHQSRSNAEVKRRMTLPEFREDDEREGMGKSGQLSLHYDKTGKRTHVLSVD